MKRLLLILLGAVITIAIAVYAGYWLAMKRMENPPPPTRTGGMISAPPQETTS